MKLFVSDLDGTLLNEKHQVSDENKAMIKKWCDAGNLFMIATGRLDQDIQHIEEDIQQLGTYRISQNGCIVRKGTETVWKKTMEKETVENIAEMLFHPNRRIEVNTESNRFYSERPADEAFEEMVEQSVHVSNLKEHTLQHLDPTIFVVIGEESEFAPIAQQIHHHHGDKVIALQTSPMTLEVFHVDGSKGNAVNYIMKELNIQPENVFVVGDSDNDISMFKLTPNAYSMQNAKPHVKEHANHTVSSVAEALTLALQ
ncbi:MAG: HAD family hydrolase [Bacilli bacterium]